MEAQLPLTQHTFEQKVDIGCFTLANSWSLVDVVASIEEEGWPDSWAFQVTDAGDREGAKVLAEHYIRTYASNMANITTGLIFAAISLGGTAGYAIGEIVDPTGNMRWFLAGLGLLVGFAGSALHPPKRIEIAYELRDRLNAGKLKFTAAPAAYVRSLPENAP